ncbi:Xaa-Pro peptidase family protein [Bacillus spongiae]|uniref:Xaa-Pro peptidase family protein n=1 Tax=Bacillus spongiae TaxID=2683610 RepID=A0ABU8HG35_9BACI
MNRLQVLQQYLTEFQIDAAFINSTENIFYLTNFYIDPHERLAGVLLFSKTEPLMIVPSMEVSQAKAAGWEHEIIGYEDHEDPWSLLQKAVNSRRISDAKTISFEKGTLSYERGESFQSLFSSPTIVSIEEKLNNMRVVKSEAEVNIIRRAALLADFGVEVGVKALKEGVTELEVVAEIEYELKKKGVRHMSFSTIVLFGEKSGEPHGNPGHRRLSKGDFVLFDLGVVLDGYCSDISRTVVFGEVNEKQKAIYEVVLKAQMASLSISKPGTRVGDLDITARNIIEENGYGDLFPHRIGHGLGINVHESPSMSQNNESILKEGMVYTIEPGIYDATIGGVRIEDDVLVTKEGHEILTKYPKNLQVIV